MRLLICGDRNWSDEKMIISEVENLKPELIIHDDFRGAAKIGSAVAEYFGIPTFAFAADWHTNGRDAGNVCHQAMLNAGKPGMVLAFHDDLEHSKGTKDMIGRAREAGVSVQIHSHFEEVNDGRQT
jgi:hypothetical protein